VIKELLFHTGDPKTGTSSIQSVLHNRAWHCDTVQLVPQQDINATPLANALLNEHPAEQRQQNFQNLRNWFDSQQGDVGVVSSEYFSRRSPQRLQEVLSEFFPEIAPRTRVLSYVRPHASRALSAYGQRLKTGTFDGSLQEFIQFIPTVSSLFYAPRFKKWRQAFGPKMVLRPFLRSQLYQGDAVSDFLHQALQTSAFELHPSPPVNETLTLAELAGLRLIQRSLSQADVVPHLKQSIGGTLQRKLSGSNQRSGTKSALDQASAAALVQAFEDDARMLDQAFFGSAIMETELHHSRDVAIAQPQSFEPEDYFSSRQIKQLQTCSKKMARKLTTMPRAWRQDYQVSIGQRQRLPGDYTAAHRKNAQAVWNNLDRLSEILIAPDLR